jgi:hypothetical protein
MSEDPRRFRSRFLYREKKAEEKEKQRQILRNINSANSESYAYNCVSNSNRKKRNSPIYKRKLPSLLLTQYMRRNYKVFVQSIFSFNCSFFVYSFSFLLC